MLSIVVLCYNRWDLTKDCLASIDTQDIPCAYEKVLVDNGSTQPMPSLPHGWRLVRYPMNLGHIMGQNRCFESAKGEWVLFVANDIRLQPGCLQSLWNRRDEISQPYLFTPTNTFDNAGLRWRWPGYGVSTCSTRPDAFTSSCYLMRKDIWIRTDKFDAHLLTSHEDVEFSLRARKMRWRISNIPEAQALHLGNATLRYQPTHTRLAFHQDRIYVIKKHYRGWNRWTRLAAVTLLDFLAACRSNRARNRNTRDTLGSPCTTSPTTPHTAGT